jgi:hypothetical protein
MSKPGALQIRTTKAPSDCYSMLLQRNSARGKSTGFTGSHSDWKTQELLARPPSMKLRVNRPGDEYEQKADRVAERVMRMAEPAKEAQPPSAATAPLARRKAAADGFGIGIAPAIVHDVVSSSGQPLDGATRAFFESRFGHDFSRVRIHADGKAAKSARSLNALAYTLGNHLVFASGKYAPRTPDGRQLLAHELTHVTQQSAVIRRQPEPEAPEFPDFPGLFQALEFNVGKNLRDYGHHLYRASILHPDEPQLLQGALTRYALGLNVLKTSYRFAGFEQNTADKLAIGTGILFKSLTFVRDGEFVLDFQMNLGKGLKFEANIDLGVNPDKPTEVRKAGLGLGLVGEF